MAAPPVVPEVYQVTTYGTLNGLSCDHVINYLLTGISGTIAAAVEAFAAADAAHFMPNLGTWLPPWYEFTSSRCVYLGDVLTPPAQVDVGTPGTSTDDFGPHSNCWTMRHPVNVRGRGKDGRTNFPGIAQPAMQQPQGTLNGGHQTFYANAWATYQSGIFTDVAGATGATPQLVVVDRKLGTYNIPRASEIDIYPNTHRRWQKRLSRHR